MTQKEILHFELRNDESSFDITEEEMIDIIYKSMVNSMFLEGDRTPFEERNSLEVMYSFKNAYSHPD